MLLRRLLSQKEDRRRSPRLQPEDVVAYYWTGGLPRPNAVSDIGPDGARIVAPGVLYLGTVIQIVFEDRAASRSHGVEGDRICVYGRVLRAVAGGFCVEFVFGGASERRRFRQFLHRLKQRNGG